MASPDNATQAYLYRCSLDGKGKAESLTPANQTGYPCVRNCLPNGKFADSSVFKLLYSVSDGMDHPAGS